MSGKRDRQRQALLDPSSVAIIGASDSAKRLTSRPQRFLAQHRFKGSVYPVNPKRETVLGMPAFRSIGDVPAHVDHATILLPADPALDALAQCIEAGVGAVTVLADGFAEAGAEGLARQDRLKDIVRGRDTLVIGPNSMGVVTPDAGFACTTNAAFALDKLPTGRFAVISQSGSIIGAMLSRGAPLGLGFRHYISVGNEATAGIGEIGQLLVDDPQIAGFVLFLETVRHPEAIAEFSAQARALGKPIVAYLVGRSEAGSALAVSHTGAMATGGPAIEAFLKAHGIQQVDQFEALIEIPEALALAARLEGRPKRATVVTTTGGGGGMLYDLLGLRGVAVTGLPPRARSTLAAQGIELRPGPIVDVTLAGAQYDMMKAVIAALIEDPESGLIVPAIGSSAQFNPELAVKPIVDAVGEAGGTAAPVVAVPIPHAPDSIRLFNAGQVPAFSSVASCAAAVSCLLQATSYSPDRPAELPEGVRRLLDNAEPGSMDEQDAGRVFEALGIMRPETSAFSREDLPDPLPFPGPYALKAISSCIAHKSEVGAVRLNLSDREAVVLAMAEMQEAVLRSEQGIEVEQFMVQPMMRGLGEAIIGLTRDPVVGPLITIGAGGVLAEVYRDFQMHPAPVSVDTARDMIAKVKGFAPLRGYRGAPNGDLEALAHAVAQLSLLAMAHEVEEAEINPVLVMEEGVIALDALIRLKGAP